LNQLSQQLQSAEQSARSSGGSSAEEALDRTRQLADNLDSMRRRLDENAARRNGNSRGQQANNQSQGNQQGNSQRGQQQGNSQRGQQQGSGQSSGTQSGQQPPGGGQPGQTSATVGGDGGDDRQLSAELRERLRDAEGLRRDWGVNGAAGRLNDVIEQLKRFADGRMEGDAQTAALLKSSVIEPLRQLELELSRQLPQQAGRTNLRLRDEGAAPERYRKAVEEYYRRLSGGQPRN
jgi:hypothetical protein